MSAQERTGWRDLSISERHRTYGFNSPAVDIDFLLTEYDRGKPVALIEYKEMRNFEGDNIDLNHPSYTAIADLGDQRLESIPFYVARYDKDPWWFRVKPANETARATWHLDGDEWQNLTEKDFVKGLYKLRGRSLDFATDVSGLDDIEVWRQHDSDRSHE